MMYAQALSARAYSCGVNMPVAFINMYECRGKWQGRLLVVTSGY
jgi:hypothetical protein